MHKAAYPALRRFKMAGRDNGNCKLKVTSQIVYVGFILLCVCFRCFGADWRTIGPSRGDQMLAEYFRAETARLRDRCLADPPCFRKKAGGTAGTDG